jgi:hypothetical protein
MLLSLPPIDLFQLTTCQFMLLTACLCHTKKYYYHDCICLEAVLNQQTAIELLHCSDCWSREGHKTEYAYPPLAVADAALK